MKTHPYHSSRKFRQSKKTVLSACKEEEKQTDRQMLKTGVSVWKRKMHLLVMIAERIRDAKFGNVHQPSFSIPGGREEGKRRCRTLASPPKTTSEHLRKSCGEKPLQLRCACVCVCVCVRESGGEGAGRGEAERERERRQESALRWACEQRRGRNECLHAQCRPL